jgi:hypothetical protein
MVGQVLSQADILVLKSYADAKDAVSYYEFLIEKGYDYGHLALGVVEGNTLAGAAARLYAETVAADDGITLSESEWQAITNELMLADFDLRKDMFDLDPSKPVELGWQPVLDYHVTVFGAHGLPPHAWTAYTVLTTSYDPNFYDPDDAWEIMLDMRSTIPFELDVLDNVGTVYMDLLYLASDEQKILGEQLFLDYPSPNPDTFGNTAWMQQNAPALYQLQILNSPAFYGQVIAQMFGNELVKFGHQILEEISEFANFLSSVATQLPTWLNGAEGIIDDLLEVGAAGLVSYGAEFAEEWSSNVMSSILSPLIPLANLGAGGHAIQSLAEQCASTYLALGDNVLVSKVVQEDGTVKYEASWWTETAEDAVDADGSTVLDTLNIASGDALKRIGDKIFLVAYDPLVLDLDGDGVETISYAAAKGAAFDLLEEDGLFADHGWVGPDDGLLAIDLNGNKAIDGISELFGNAEVSGFDALAQYDEDNDGIISGDDAVFNDLFVWRDANSDGVSQEGELHTLDDLGIISISLGGSLTFEENNGNYIRQTGAVAYANGNENVIADVNFAVDVTSLRTGSSGGLVFEWA